jgi:hypothetical protein
MLLNDDAPDDAVNMRKCLHRVEGLLVQVE